MKKYRNGISLVLLVVMVVVIIALLTVGVVSFTNTYKISGISAFSNDLKDIEDLAGAYIIENGTSSLETMTKTEVVNLVEEGKRAEFTQELNLNLDNEENTFYIVDLSKIGVKKSVRGYSTNGIDDLYVMTTNSLHAYYLKGLNVSDTIYFSLSQKSVDALNNAYTPGEYNKYWICKNGVRYGEWSTRVEGSYPSEGTIEDGNGYFELVGSGGYFTYAHKTGIDLSQYKYCYVEVSSTPCILTRIYILNKCPHNTSGDGIHTNFASAVLIQNKNGKSLYRFDISTLNIYGYFALDCYQAENNHIKVYNIYFEKEEI